MIDIRKDLPQISKCEKIQRNSQIWLLRSFHTSQSVTNIRWDDMQLPKRTSFYEDIKNTHIDGKKLFGI